MIYFATSKRCFLWFRGWSLGFSCISVGELKGKACRGLLGGGGGGQMLQLDSMALY